MSGNKIVRVTYSFEDDFLIPSNINLENEEQVEDWWVKYNTLNISLKNGKVLEINSRGRCDDIDLKHTDHEEILDADDGGYDDHEFKEVDLGEEEEEEEEDGTFLGEEDTEEVVLKECEVTPEPASNNFEQMWKAMGLPVASFGCVCGECADCRPDLHQKKNECVRCGCYNLSEFKKVEHKHIHCLDCYKQVRNAKKRENRKQKKEEKKKEEEEEDIEFCDCGYIHHCEDKCPNETTREHYERWKEEDDVQKCYNCDEVLDEDMHIFCYRKGDDEMVHCQQCAEDCYEEAKADGWIRDDDEGSTTEEEEDDVECYACGDVPCIKQEDPMDMRLCKSCNEESEKIHAALNK
jgi:hypothetical protein